MTKIIFLRHAKTKKNPSLNSFFWKLSEEGKKQAEEIEIKNVDVIYSSKEPKAFLTVLPLSKKIKKEIYPLSFFDEVKREDGFSSEEEFKKEKSKQLENLSYCAFNGESGKEALERFEKGVLKIEKENKEKTILVCSHGTILNIYFAKKLNAYNNLKERFLKTDFCSYGIIENGNVIKDIIEND